MGVCQFDVKSLKVLKTLDFEAFAFYNYYIRKFKALNYKFKIIGGKKNDFKRK